MSAHIPEYRFTPPDYIKSITVSQDSEQILLSLGTAIVEVLLYLDVTSLLNFACCSKKWNDICSDDFVWGKIYAHQGWGISPKLAKTNPTLTVTQLVSHSTITTFGRTSNFKAAVMEKLRFEFYVLMHRPNWMWIPVGTSKFPPPARGATHLPQLGKFMENFGIFPSFVCALNTKRSLQEIVNEKGPTELATSLSEWVHRKNKLK